MPRRACAQVRSGAANASWSAPFEFRAPGGMGSGAAYPVTRIATYGDMGHSRYNCMANLQADAKAGPVDASKPSVRAGRTLVSQSLPEPLARSNISGFWRWSLLNQVLI